MIVFLLTIAASVAALIGGYTAIRSKRWLNLALALTSGLVLGLVTFDLLPEIFEIAESEKLDPVWPMIAMTVGFLIFHLFEKLVPLHEASEQQYSPHRHPKLGAARAIALSGHSFLDGLSIGVGFQVSTAVGTAVAIAVIGHRFADGFDTTTFMLFHKNKLTHIKRWLAVVVLMPVAGGLASLTFSLSESALAIYLGFFAGLILYISASNLLPEAHSEHSSYRAFGATIIGVAFIFAVTRLA
ncbi:MAG TPA: ZIP family metal transporter [Candidatus Saccharimonadales bacterium]|nr:ZIP family metal transporter [Candidatus Saccharimonadales bacterium]